MICSFGVATHDVTLSNLVLTDNQAGNMWKLLDEHSHADKEYR